VGDAQRGLTTYGWLALYAGAVPAGLVIGAIGSTLWRVLTGG
jgi:hypothetical protein